MSGLRNQPDASPEEVRIVNERAKLRKALRQEYLRKFTDPNYPEAIVFDPGLQRNYSMHMTIYERFIPTVKNFSMFMGLIVLPVIGLGLLFKTSRDKFERKCRSGEIPYEQRTFKAM